MWELNNVKSCDCCRAWLVLLIGTIWNARLGISREYYKCTTGTLMYLWNVFGYCADALPEKNNAWKIKLRFGFRNSLRSFSLLTPSSIRLSSLLNFKCHLFRQGIRITIMDASPLTPTPTCSPSRLCSAHSVLYIVLATRAVFSLRLNTITSVYSKCTVRARCNWEEWW